jgi:hypothetical protein
MDSLDDMIASGKLRERIAEEERKRLQLMFEAYRSYTKERFVLKYESQSLTKARLWAWLMRRAGLTCWWVHELRISKGRQVWYWMVRAYEDENEPEYNGLSERLFG